MTYDNTNKGTLGSNERKEKDTHPDVKGKCDIKCEQCGRVQSMWLSGWNRTGQRGSFVSLAFEIAKKASDAMSPARKKSEPAQDDPDFDQDIPF